MAGLIDNAMQPPEGDGMEILGPDGQPVYVDGNQLSSMNWDNLIALRHANTKNQKAQQLLADYEHRAYAREEVAKNPLKAPIYPLMTAGYQGMKVVRDAVTGTPEGGTPPSLKQAAAGLKGTAEGLGIAWDQFVASKRQQFGFNPQPGVKVASK